MKIHGVRFSLNSLEVYLVMHFRFILLLVMVMRPSFIYLKELALLRSGEDERDHSGP
jgi:hypothetical protein